jgi:hypothetical protein
MSPFHSGGETAVNAAELAERTGTARRKLEPLLQALPQERLLGKQAYHVTPPSVRAAASGDPDRHMRAERTGMSPHVIRGVASPIAASLGQPADN